MAIIQPASADFTDYNTPGGTFLTGVGASWTAFPQLLYGDQVWHGYTRPWVNYAKTRVYCNVVASTLATRNMGFFAVLRQNGPNYNAVGMLINAGAFGEPMSFGERWTMPGTFSALTGTTAAAEAGNSEFLDGNTLFTGFEIRYSAGTLSFWGSPCYPENDAPWVNRGTNEAVATWLGGDPTEWGYFVRRVGLTAGSSSVLQWRGYEEIP